jgi:tripartite-type tricarboxylate transporter receptor subunit TctC
MIDLLAGVIKVGFVSMSGVINYLSEGKLRGLGVSSAERSRLAPNVPTVAESGYPEFQVDSYILILAPAGIPEQIATLLEREVRHVVQLPEFQQQFRARDVQSVGSTAAEAKAWIRQETKRWSSVIKAANMRVD